MSTNDKALRVPSLTVSGTPFEAGKAKGEAARLGLANACRNLVNEHHDPAWLSRFLSAAERHLSDTRAVFPHVTEEIEGVAAGAGIPVVWIAALVTSNDVVLEAEECTNLGFAKTPDGPLWGGNADGCRFPLVEVRDVQGVFRSVVGHGNITGVVNGWGGINEHGLALGHSGISPGREGGRIPAKYRVEARHTSAWDTEPLAICPQARLVLDRCRSVGEAVELLKRNDMRGQGNCLLIDANGESAVVERHGTWLYVWPGDEQGAFCGNLTRSMLDPKVYDAPDEEVYSELDPPHWPGIWGRYRAAEDAVTKHAAEHSLAFMKQTLRSHVGDITRTCAICNWATNASYMAACRDRKFFAAMAPPCQHHYVEYEVPGVEAHRLWPSPDYGATGKAGRRTSVEQGGRRC